jgi:hypothetical protein
MQRRSYIYSHTNDVLYCVVHLIYLQFDQTNTKCLCYEFPKGKKRILHCFSPETIDSYDNSVAAALPNCL